MNASEYKEVKRERDGDLLQQLRLSITLTLARLRARVRILDGCLWKKGKIAFGF
jgi:hypothetical protein